jgi:hypothetical protein
MRARELVIYELDASSEEIVSGGLYKEPVMHDCWICGSVANTSEHSVKKTDLKTIFSNKPKRFIAHHFDEEYNTKRKTLIQGLNSKHLKYDKDLCENCNTNLTRPYDLAYEEFIKYVFKNEKVIIGEGTEKKPGQIYL